MAIDLFTRIQQHNQERGWMPDGYQDLSRRPRTQYSPATGAQVHVTESILGFALPGQLRALLQAVGNGGFGPAYGIAGAHDGFPVAGIGGTLEQSYQDYCAGKTLVDYTHYQQEPGVFLLPHDVWSARLLPFADLGCVKNDVYRHHHWRSASRRPYQRIALSPTQREFVIGGLAGKLAG